MRLPMVLLLTLASVAAAEDRKAQLADADPAVRREAATALAKAGAADAVPELAECLVDEDARLRAAAARALGRAGATATPALPELKRLLSDDEKDVRAEALAAIARIGDVAGVAEAVKRDRGLLALFGTAHDGALRALLGADSWHVRLWVVQLDRIRREPAQQWTEPLARLAADDPTGAVRLHALTALTRAPSAEPHLRMHLDDADPRMRAIAVAGLPKQVADATAQEVERLLADPVPQIRARATYAMRARPDLTPAVEKLLDDEEAKVRETAAVVLASHGVWCDRAAPLVVAAALRFGFDPPFPHVGDRRNLRAGGGSGGLHAHQTYPFIDAMARRAVLEAGNNAAPHLARALEAEPEAFRRGELVHALGRAGAKETLATALKDENIFVRRRAAFCLAALGSRDFAVLRQIIGCLEDDEARLHLVDWAATAADTLVALGDEAVPLLEARLRKLDAESAETERIQAILARIRKSR